MSAHTPGPWVAKTSPGRQHFEVRGPFGGASAPLFDIMRSVDERRANAHLIAAAPDLLDAVKLTMLCFARTQASGGWLGADEHEAWTALVKAFDKAEGR